MYRLKHTVYRGMAVLVVLAIMAVGMNTAHAKNIKKQNLLELMSHTDSILIGTVEKQTDGFYKGLPYTEITVSVGQSIKGNHGSTYKFRQFGLLEPRSMNGRVNLMVTPAGWPTYSDGEQVMLFLHKPASETGFQTTAGLTQGKFTLRGNKVANGINNDSLFADMEINTSLSQEHSNLVSQQGGAYSTDAFLSLVKTAVNENWIGSGVMTHEK